MTAIDTLLDGLIDYAGTYPPSGLSLEIAVPRYLHYRRGPQAHALGRFVVDADRLRELRGAASPAIADIPLTICVTRATDLNSVVLNLAPDLHADSFEIRNAAPAQIADLTRRLPAAADAYFEVPLTDPLTAPPCPEALDAACAAGARIKLRMGGLVAGAFPSTLATVTMLRALAERHLAFKATAGLHHPLRSRHEFTYASDSPVGTMHGFFNLFCAAALMYFGGDEQDACAALNESDQAAWQVAPDSISWRSFHLTTHQIHEVRQEFFTSFGSCSFEEPIADLEALGWL